MAKTDEKQESCASGLAPNVVLACSGASDVGELTDLAARKLAAEGVATMLGLAGISGGVSAIVNAARAAPVRLAIDGCPIDCAERFSNWLAWVRSSTCDSPTWAWTGVCPRSPINGSRPWSTAKMRLGGQIL